MSTHWVPGILGPENSDLWKSLYLRSPHSSFSSWIMDARDDLEDLVLSSDSLRATSESSKFVMNACKEV